MALKVKCPECESSLTLAKAPAPGKKLRCPRCSAVFAPVDEDEDVPIPEEDEEEVAPAPKKRAVSKEAVKKGGPSRSAPPPPAPAPPPAAPKPPLPDGDDEGDGEGGIYGFKETPEEEQKHEESKPKIEYAPDMSVKDPRGPATAIIAKPAGFLLLDCGMLFFGAVFGFLYGVWPFLFADHVYDPTDAQQLVNYIKKRDNPQQGKDGGGGGGGGGLAREGSLQKKLQEIEGEAFDKEMEQILENLNPDKLEFSEPVKLEDMQKNEFDKLPYKVWEWMNDRKTTKHIWVIVIAVLLAIYASLMSFGSVKLLHLESYGWSMTGSIMACVIRLPIFAVGIMFLAAAFSEDDLGVMLMNYIKAGVVLGYNSTATYQVITNLLNIRRPDVIEAFHWKPDQDEKEEGSGEKKDLDEDEDEEEEDEDEE